MNIGILGSGAVGTTLARGFSARGHDVALGTGHPEDHRALEPAVRVGSFAQAAAHGDLVVLAVRWSAVDAILAELPAGALDGKIVVDTSNPLAYDGGRPSGVRIPPEGSAGQHVAMLLPRAHVVKAFNTVGAALMVDPQLPGGPPDMFICGDDDDAKRKVAELCEALRYPALDVGSLAMSAQLEHLAWLWISLAMTGRFDAHAFALLRREKA
ncbi:MAG TPA: NADPH-dependent F420 reductase [Candidatus Elarobacter sp.]|nr:NADPH-dependent F420 reductase [Candidatus Elarobacter sp.]